jgi:hypothetical protein
VTPPQAKLATLPDLPAKQRLGANQHTKRQRPPLKKKTPLSIRKEYTLSKNKKQGIFERIIEIF